jgi:predicted  nucleic acid-binding Zn-ribbon protein
VNIKKEAYEAVVKKLEDELASVQSRIMRNKYQFKSLAQEQAKLKRERGIITETLRTVRGDCKSKCGA